MANPVINNTNLDRLEAGNNVYRNVSIDAGQDLKRGSVLGKITADSVYKLVDSASSDGSELAICILTQDIDTSSTGTNADTDGQVLVSGFVNGDKCIYGGTSDTADSAATDKLSFRESLQDHGITILDITSGVVSKEDNQ